MDIVSTTVRKTGMVKATEIGEDATLDVVNDPDATEDGMGIFEKFVKLKVAFKEFI